MMQLATLNFRDLGGLPAGDGRKLRHRVLLRGEGPKNLRDPHIRELRELGVRAIFDLRSDGERDADPHDWQDPGCRVLNLDINHDLRAAGATEWDRLRDSPDPQAGWIVMHQNYAAMPGALLPHWRAIVDALLDDCVPALVNCTAGKDRTGVAIALLLDLLGIDRDAIVADYLRSSVFGDNMAIQGSIERGFLESFGFVPGQQVIDAMIGVDKDYLGAAQDLVNTRWGGIARYFAAAGVDAAEQRELQLRLTETC